MREGKILIIDDDPDITEAMSVVLRNKGYNVRVAHDSDQGRERLEEMKPDLIILDVMMRTSQEGFEFSREIKQDARFKDIPILMLTGVKEKKGIDFKSAAGDENWLPVQAFLDKPVKPDVLIEKVQDLLATPQA
ncbi:MAG TPA: response regulator [Sedimentisphaerales bacterium]|nr:response regulator [Phycisphaerae bacterium]HOV77834.1 response regulator [Sedimentisphaerales bacterium]